MGDYPLVLDLKAAAPMLVQHVDGMTREVLEASIERFSRIELRGRESYSKNVVAVLGVDQHYTNPETGVTVHIPAGFGFTWPLDSDHYPGGTMFTASGGISKLVCADGETLEWGAWDCTDFYGKDEITHPVFSHILGSLSLVDLFMQHATNMDGYDGSVGSGHALGKYIGEWGLSMDNVPDMMNHQVTYRHFDDDGEDISWYACTGCDGDVHPEDVFWFADDPYCQSCYGHRFATCGACGQSFDRDDLVYCEDIGELRCAAHRYFCDRCECYVAAELVSIGTEWVCPDCSEDMVTCADCGVALHLDQNIVYDSLDSDHPEDARVCERCHDRQLERDAEPRVEVG